MNKLQSLRITITILVLLFCFSCAPVKVQQRSKVADFKKDSLPDYRQLLNWAAHPAKMDPSDSIPLPLKDGSLLEKAAADVFFIHPTTFTNRKDSAYNASIDDSVLNRKTDYSSILFQASAFNTFPVYAPRYRQAHLRNYYSADTVKALQAFDRAYEDVKAAFKHYLENENNGRPIIIASHSQGTTHAKKLLKEFFEGKPLQQQLVAAYLLGMYIPENYFETIPVCKDAVSIGCVIAWRTFQDGYLPDFVEKEKVKSMVINPLTWSTAEGYAKSELNNGAVLRNFNKINKHAADASIHKGILWIHKPNVPGKFFIRMKNYHIGDINLFYMNIRTNTVLRAAQFLQQKDKRIPQ